MPTTKRIESKTIVAVGFAAVLGLMAALILAGIGMLDSGLRRLDTVVHHHNLKTELVNRMRSAALGRTLSLHKMMLQEDPFERDAQWMRLNQLGAEFADAREQLLQLPMSPIEAELMQRQSQITAAVASFQQEVAALIQQHNQDAAYGLLLSEVIPGQEGTFAVLSELVQYQKDAADRAVKEARAEFSQTLWRMLMLAVIFALATLFIAYLVRRQTVDAEQRLFKAKEHAQTTLHSIGEGVVCADAKGRAEELNEAAAALIGRDAADMIGEPIGTIMPLTPEGDLDTALDPVARVLDQGGLITSDGNAILHRPNGDNLAVEFTASPIHDRQRNIVGAILVFRDVTQMRAMSKQLSYHARHDDLTGLLNRREFELRVQEALDDMQRHRTECWLCYIDMDQFKIINDTCGHLAGDELLKLVANTLDSYVRDVDVVARLGGDEFAILIRRSNQQGVLTMVERIRLALQELHFAWDDKHFGTSASVGLVPINRDTGTLYELLSTADSACYLAKEGGRNRVHLYAPDDAAMAQRDGEMQWVHRITKALEENRFVLYYQAIARLSGDPSSRCGEILVRMIDPDGNLVPPMAFIPAAERYGLMSRIDRWVVRHTIELLQQQAPAGFGDDGWISVNLSAQSLCDDGFLELVLRLLDQSSLDPGMICFEITETSAIANLARAMEFITRLRDRGCRFALDDFGSGVSSFAYLKNLPVDIVKIDGTFVRDIQENEINLALVEAINRVGHVMGIRTVAEYVENLEIVRLLQELGVDYGQGFGIHEPVPLTEALGTQNMPSVEVV